MTQEEVKKVRKIEQELWNKYRNYKNKYGEDDEATTLVRLQWHQTVNIMNVLNIYVN